MFLYRISSNNLLGLISTKFTIREKEKIFLFFFNDKLPVAKEGPLLRVAGVTMEEGAVGDGEVVR